MGKIWLKIEILFGQFYDWISGWLPFIWNLEFFNIDKNPITFGRLIIGLIAFLIGYQAAKRFSSQIEKRILTHLDIAPAFRSSIKTFTFYILILFLFLFVLQLLNIPLTALTIAGGALAFGIGLGAQSIIYDLLSGLVIMLEHPIREGDLVELDDQVRGKVENIGPRATKVYTVDNKHLIIPNNFFLSKTVLNWTLSNEIIRSEVRIGVTYEADLEKVKEILLKVADENKSIKKHPEPVILLSDFGDSAIIFDVYFWAQVNSLLQMKKIQSAMRFQLSKILKENKIIIAFPQRDIHLKPNLAPFKVEVLPHSKD